jgi:hypothetical protein
MHIRKVRGPRTVQLPDGGYLSRGDLPLPNTKRWVASREAAVMKAVRIGLISLEEACSLYDLTQDEYSSWQTAVARHGESVLRATALKKRNRQFYQYFKQIKFLSNIKFTSLFQHLFSCHWGFLCGYF